MLALMHQEKVVSVCTTVPLSALRIRYAVSCEALRLTDLHLK